LFLSPFFRWINIGMGGVTGLSGDGKILLVATAIGAFAYLSTLITRKLIADLLLLVQAYGTVAAFWMGALIWKVGSLPQSPELEDSPFAAALSSALVSPGTGLYIGFVGGIAVAGSLGFVSIRQLQSSGRFLPFYLSQGLSLVVGIVLAVSLVEPNESSLTDDEADSPINSQTEIAATLDLPPPSPADPGARASTADSSPSMIIIESGQGQRVRKRHEQNVKRQAAGPDTNSSARSADESDAKVEAIRQRLRDNWPVPQEELKRRAEEKQREEEEKQRRQEEAKRRQEEERRIAEKEARRRTWTDVSGEFSVDAYFVGYGGGVVRIERADNGEVIQVPLNRLSKDDQDWIDSMRKKEPR
jgi:hypothetical protein